MIKYIKMSNGEILIGDCVDKTEYNIIITNPMIIVIDRLANNGAYYIGEYLIMSKNKTIPLFYKDIICVIDPDDTLLKQYNDIFHKESNDKEESPKLKVRVDKNKFH